MQSSAVSESDRRSRRSKKKNDENSKTPNLYIPIIDLRQVPDILMEHLLSTIRVYDYSKIIMNKQVAELKQGT